MYAILEVQGKQYKISEGDIIKVEKMSHKPGDKITLDKIIALIPAEDGKDTEKTILGNPYIKGASVSAEVTRQGKNKKIIVFKYKSKKRYRKKTGHRQSYTLIKIEKIKTTTRKSAAEKAK